MSPQQIDALRRELQQMRAESAAAHRELRQEMQTGFARLEDRFDHRHSDHEKRIRALEIWRSWMAGVSAAFGGVAGYVTRMFGGE